MIAIEGLIQIFSSGDGREPEQSSKRGNIKPPSARWPNKSAVDGKLSRKWNDHFLLFAFDQILNNVKKHI